MSVCSSLIAIVDQGGHQVVQFSHFSVKEYLTSERLAAAEERLSYYHILPEPAHTTLAHASLSVLLHLDDTIGRDTMRGRPGNLLPLLTHMAIGRVKESPLSLGTTTPLRAFLIFWRPFFFASAININLTIFFSLKGWHMCT